MICALNSILPIHFYQTGKCHRYLFVYAIHLICYGYITFHIFLTFYVIN